MENFLVRSYQVSWNLRVINFRVDGRKDTFCPRRFTDSDYPFGIFKVFLLELTKDMHLYHIRTWFKMALPLCSCGPLATAQRAYAFRRHCTRF
jgi:hypothetical protein